MLPTSLFEVWKMLKQAFRLLATQASKVVSERPIFKTAESPKFTLASLRSFPSLEPHSFIPLPASFFDAPLRRDFLWSAVVFEADRARVGSGNVMTRGDQLYSHKKLRPQKGSGRARVGDANSPTRDNPIKAHGIKAPHDWSTKLPRKVYSKAMQVAFSQVYRDGKLFIIGGDKSSLSNEYDDVISDFKYNYEEATKQFIAAHRLQRLNLLFITDDQRTNLIESTGYIGKKASVLIKEAVEVRDILKANRIYIEAPALQWLIGKFE